ncbi:unnamed protein product [Acanthoscelides obtectus]|uniref:Peptidase aspartic putative domain-containing protein n=1 Tax=Acanthoscelides obtectus TaxID=200917 RepID=A0A9P0QFW2_ACAOB|nr:unnamed protein product [Acanthoscelides obtectus]CAK1685386.1 hypothetical protein AOBTE_LOCUS35359 [Acanthoscelides obtectus]
MLIGIEVFYELLCIGQVKLGIDMPLLQKTVLGWVVSGPLSLYPSNNRCTSICNLSVNNDNIQRQLASFWEIEEIPTERPKSVEENSCETHFVNTTRRDTDGRFIVSIPFKDSVSKLGDSKFISEKRFHKLEKRLVTDLNFRESYNDFMKEYEVLNHMARVDAMI